MHKGITKRFTCKRLCMKSGGKYPDWLGSACILESKHFERHLALNHSGLL
jgi:hypothetical protein